MAEAEFGNVPMEVLPAHVVEGTNIPAFEQGPEALDAVGGCYFAHVLTHRVVDPLVTVTAMG